MLDTTKDSSHTSFSLNHNNNISKKPKDLSLFNWFTSFTNNSKSCSNNIDKSNNINTSRFKGSVPNLDTNFDNIEQISIPPASDDFRGVEGLTQYWNHRITFTNNLLQKQTARAHFKSEINSVYKPNGLKPSKSIGCLITTTKNEDDLKNSNSFRISFNDDNKTNEEHIKSDNFYKYKTADTNKRKSSESNIRLLTTRDSISQTNSKNFSSDIGNRNYILSFGIDSFPLVAATERGEKIHWAKREDIFINRKQKPSSLNDEKINKLNNNCLLYNDRIFDKKLLNDIKDMTTENDKIISVRDLINKNKSLFDKKIVIENTKYKPTNQANNKMEIKNSNQTIITINNNNSDSHLNENLSLSKEQQVVEYTNLETSNTVDCPNTNIDNDNNRDKEKSKDKTDNLKNNAIMKSNESQNGSMNSLTSNSVESPIRRKSQTSATRKCSFKTHSKNFHVSRKMTNHFTAHHHHHHPNNNNSKVATLTAQFNQLIQRDNTLLEEIKKKNGVLLTRGGHIYKLKEDSSSPNVKKRNSTKRFSQTDSSDETSSIKSGRRKIIAKRLSNDSSVKAAVKKFETSRLGSEKSKPYGTNTPNKQNNNYKSDKPKVPAKSEIVLKKTKEINIKHSLKKQRPKTIDIQSNNTLEDIKEESKTPVQETNESTTSLNDELKSSEVVNQSCIPNNPTNKMSCSPVLALNSLNTDNLSNESNTMLESSSETLENLPKKSRYARIYEKIRLKNTIFSHKKSQNVKPSPENEENPIKKLEPDKKIREAIETINKRIETLSKSTNDINIQHQNHDKNESFVYNNKTKVMSFGSNTELTNKIDEINQNNIIQAVNTSLINKTQSMDDSKFLSTLNYQILMEDNEQNHSKKDDEDVYEPINVKAKIDCTPAPQKSFLFTRFHSHNESSKSNDTTAQTENLDCINNNSERSRSVSDCTFDSKLYQKSFLYSKDFNKTKTSSFSSSLSKTQDHEDCLNIYQTIPEIIKPLSENYTEKTEIVDDENYQLVNELPNPKSSPNQTEDGYEICEPPASDLIDINKFELEKLKQQKLPTLNSPRISETQRNTTDELPAIPEPKRKAKPFLLNTNNNNNTICTDVPPRPPNKSPLLNNSTKKISENPLILPLNDIDCQLIMKNISNYDNYHYEDEDENIYDTIKGSESLMHCYEMLNNNGKHSPKSVDDTTSIVSNCYESIASIRGRVAIPLTNSDSISTISSDHKTNSLYGVSMNSQNFIPLNEGSSDNNDDWIDISDGDDDFSINNNRPHFIIVREKSTKANKGTEWSTLVHNHRIQRELNEDEDYDSDHYYEPLYPSTNNGKNQIPIDTSSEHNKSARLKYQNNQTITAPSKNNNKNYNNIAIIASNQLSTLPQSNHHHLYTDDYDSFDSDDETDEDVKKNDSGVDISNKKLPDPPSTTNQVYAFVKKFKNFISNKKTIVKPNENGKQYENTKFFVTPNEYQNTDFNTTDRKLTKKKTPNLHKKMQNPKPNQENQDPYENTEFHRPIRLTKQKSIEELENVSPDTSAIATTMQSTQSGSQASTPTLDNVKFSATVNRRKSKSENSFKSKIRKSLTSHQNVENKNGHNSTTRSTFYISDSVDLDSGIFEKTHSSSNQTLTDSNQQHELTPNKNDNSQPVSNSIAPTTLGRKNKKSNKSSPDLQRRRTTIGIRPNNPPPPPPVDKKNSNKRPQTSWYAECGVFKANGLSTENNFKDQNRNERSNNTSWYAEAGLYQTSGASVASSSGSSGVSTGGENCPFDDNNSHSMFLNEPLYQIYSAEKLESISRDMEDHESTDGYEEISTQHKKPPRPSALQLVGPKCGPSRTLWSEIPEVVNSQILSTLTSQEKRLQEAKFEILTSEASYLKSLNLLRTHFMNHPAFRDANILNPSDRKTLFSYLVPVHECSDRLLCDLESCWQDNIMLIGLSRSIFKNAEKYFHVYISFCEHQGKMDRTLRRLKEQKSAFNQILDTLEKDPVCYGLNLHSFLMLPMQRITRLPLLIDAVFSKVKTDDSEYESWKMTLAILNKIVLQCNEAANRCEQAYEIERISKQIEFPATLRSFPIAPVGVLAPGSKPRFLVKRGEFVHLIWRGDDAKLTFGKKFSKTNIYAFLFTDLLILTKKKSDEQFTVFDYCPRNMVTLAVGDSIPHLPIKDANQIGKNLILLTLLENHEGKTIEMIISCPSVSEQQRWLEACTPPEPESPGEKLYEQWDCPQVITKHEYIATEPDLLSLEPGDVVNVTRKMPDGWFQGERIRDGVTGWFPGHYTEEVNSPHVRARNLKQRHRLLTFTAAYLEMQKKK
ncbi:putative uncharacterized protein DDB_G0282133 [Condylostylus longicornis]|uniref:putative uncharacterized protein DDB_G0282133 n=1 Tax=Condylostylus longicornis TaxID=2530218 RepID=UPI00244DDFB1|nr:putative uncharacterized protein DDB_G0282133 [Condylostylus longicornis]XP_055384122.1 putative uncharacterized protein DDB_G0282133 [Condylostylus longicornis]